MQDKEAEAGNGPDDSDAADFGAALAEAAQEVSRS